jgi:type I restriction enzyme M protein
MMLAQAQQGDVRVRQHNGRKKHNQYFTPQPVVRFALSLVPTRNVSTAIDPAMGDGAFLLEAEKMWTKASFFGVDIDESIIANMRQWLPTGFYLFAGDGLKSTTFATHDIKAALDAGGFDLVVGNPPFSSWFDRVTDPEILAAYQLARRHDGTMMSSQAIEVLFLEQFLRLAKAYGWVVIVLPDGVLGSPRYQAVRDFILQQASVKFVVSLPRYTFAGTSAKTSLVILQKATPACRGPAQLIEVNSDGSMLCKIQVAEDHLRQRMDFAYHCRASNDDVELPSAQWESNPLAKYCVHFQTGRTLYGAKRVFAQQGLRFLHATNITDIGIDYTRNERYVEPNSPMDSPKAHVCPEDILFVRVGAGCAGRTAVVVDEDDMGVASDYIHIIRVQGIDPYFLVVYLKTRFGKQAIDLRKHGVATISLNKTDVLSLPIPDLPVDLQSAIGRRYRSLLLEWRADSIRSKRQTYYKGKLSNILNCLEHALMEGDTMGVISGC